MESVFDLQDEQRRYQHASETLQWMQANAEVLANKKINLPSAPKPLEKSLLAIASETAGPLGLEFQSVQPNGDESIQLQLQAVLFADALAWFRVLHNTEGLVVGQITLGKHENPSHVDVSIQLQDVARSNLSNDANSVRSSTLVVNRKN
jgi:type II secretory pathway component PulM